MNVSLKQKEFDLIRELIDSKFYDYTDHMDEEELTKNEGYQELIKLDKKLIKSFNKQTRKWYKWQLKDSEKPVTRDNIEEEWL